MKLDPGKVIEEFDINNRKVRFRYPVKSDAKGLVAYVNIMIKDREYIGKQTPVILQEEIKWLRQTLKDMRKGNLIDIVIEMDGKIVGNAQIKRNLIDAARNSGEFALGISKEAQNLGIGTRLMRTLIQQSKLMKIRTIELDTLGPNERAIHVYEKSGFKHVGKIPNFYNHYGKYCDKVILYQEVR